MNQLIRFCIVGCANAAINYGLFFVSYRYWPFSLMLTKMLGQLNGINMFAPFLAKLGRLSIDGAVANMIGFVAGMVNSFFWNKFWTFKVAYGTKNQAGKFVITNIISLILSTASLLLFTDLFRLQPDRVWLVTMFFVTLLHFLTNKFWVFRV